MPKVQNVQKGTNMMTNVSQSIAKKFRFVQKKTVQMYSNICKKSNYAKGQPGPCNFKMYQSSFYFFLAGKTEVYTQGITLHWVTRSEIILDLNQNLNVDLMNQSFGRCQQGEHAFPKELRKGKMRGKKFKYKKQRHSYIPVECSPFKVIPQLLTHYITYTI